jgi:hypothetical protein
LIKKRLECPQQIEEEIADLRKDFLLNNKCNMLVLVSMATDEMIRLVSMFPDVFFMDTTAGECILILIYYEFIVFVTYEFIFSMNSYYSLHMNSYAFLKYDFLYCLNVQVLTGTEKNYLLWL